MVYGIIIREGARAREYEDAINWLESAGLVYKTTLTTSPSYPLIAYDSQTGFKLYLFDTGLLKYMAGIENQSLILNTDFGFKGALSENYILQQLISQFTIKPRYYAVNRVMEIDFVIQSGTHIYPIEVKSSTNIQSKSLLKFRDKFDPNLLIRFSRLNFKLDDGFLNIPLYLASKTKNIIESMSRS